ncbi:MAG: hypothetical protein EBS53_06285 [Bacteroidetes bacterium]|nr:hypothetical protein [Bacteroidota bacterium]
MPRRGVPTTLFVADVIRRFVDGWSELGMANLAAEDGGAEGEAGGRRTRLILHGWHTTKPSER